MWYYRREGNKKMTPYERMIEHQHWIEFETSRVAGLENQVARGIRVDPTFMAVIESSIGFIWPMSSEQERVKLQALRTRVNKIRSLNPPPRELPLYTPLFGY